ncbi:MAG: pirin family protein [Marmoricola sp.]
MTCRWAGLRAMTVRRTLPQRQRTLIGAWCFVDHYGPDRVFESGGMDVPPHPHTGLQTASWLFRGRDRASRQCRHTTPWCSPGELNSDDRRQRHLALGADPLTTTTSILAGIQLWIALPEARAASSDAGFEHYAPPAD